ncbi:hypothetical protein BDM02DRAFT_3265514 [Thelephora ganbajun]|uniref:Uncharacterized protein n=1 Tax=Thelephora ganbajun TaxID=370292 RepID=A0ACB6ZUP4_THEGA|nr:hypothetical protein BDM02DRAFT_3265514 [Thelephora ganbajun]
MPPLQNRADHRLGNPTILFFSQLLARFGCTQKVVSPPPAGIRNATQIRATADSDVNLWLTPSITFPLLSTVRMPLPSLPLDVLLVVFRDLDVVDVVRIGMTCKDLYQVVQDRHVWIDQLEKLCQKNPALGFATPPLTSLPAQELKTFVTGRVKLCLRWDKGADEDGFVTKGLIELPGVCHLKLLPGGKSLLVIDNRGGVTLRNIRLGDGQVSLPIVASINPDQMVTARPGRSKLLTATSPCPILVHCQGNNVQILRIDRHKGYMSSETTFRLPDGYNFLHAHGQGRVVGFLIRRMPEPPRAVVVHLDYPGVIMESEVSPTCALGTGPVPYLWNICIPTERLMILYNSRQILGCKIPNFSTLSLGVNPTSATPMWNWSGLEWFKIRVSYMASEATYNPPSSQEFNLYYVCRRPNFKVITVTIPINTGDDSASEPIKLPAVKQRSTFVQNHARHPGEHSCQKGLHFDKACRSDGVRYLIAPLKDIASEGLRRALGVFVSYKELSRLSQAFEIDMDEATGRVVIWGRNKDASETKVFVGDLV